ncbi:MAG: AraC family transcriptional regulator [Bacteroidales bacterium]|nr:AraC family transcriptional regulator [Bacteroidales bacterium]
MDNRPDIIIENTLTEIDSDRFVGYLAHAFCRNGYSTFTFNNEQLRFEAGNCLILTRCNTVANVVQSPDFMVDVVYVAQPFIEVCTPQSNYGMKGHLALFNNPIMQLNPEQQEVCMLNFDYIKRRYAFTNHHFHREAMINAIQRMIIDFFDFHAELYGNEEKVTSQYSQIMDGFLALLERGDYHENREIGYYADKLCVTPKYLSEVTKKLSGFPANYWITRYTALEISRLLRDRSLTLTEISDRFNFSSPSYFTRYVQKYLGANPMDFRE